MFGVVCLHVNNKPDAFFKLRLDTFSRLMGPGTNIERHVSADGRRCSLWLKETPNRWFHTLMGPDTNNITSLLLRLEQRRLLR
jgi:hypothetical protein